jgi:hypothetical protein
MKYASLLLAMLIVVPATGQEHAPTAARCQADAAVWGDRQAEADCLDAGAEKNTTKIGGLGYKEVIARIGEMEKCVKIDPPGKDKYYEVAVFYNSSVLSSRVYNFMQRHDFWPLFAAEDTEGKR